MEDRELICAACGQGFPFSASEQAYYAERGFQEPKRCRSCRQNRKRASGASGGGAGGGGGRRRSGGGRASASQRVHRVEARRAYPAACVDCGADITTPFPARDTTIRCADCFRARYAG